MTDLQLLKAGQFYQLIRKYKRRLGVWYADYPCVFAKLNKAKPPRTDAAVWPWLRELVLSCEKEAALFFFLDVLAFSDNLDFDSLYRLAVDGECSPSFRRQLRRKPKIVESLLAFINIQNPTVVNITKAA